MDPDVLAGVNEFLAARGARSAAVTPDGALLVARTAEAAPTVDVVGPDDAGPDDTARPDDASRTADPTRTDDAGLVVDLATGEAVATVPAHRHLPPTPDADASALATYDGEAVQIRSLPDGDLLAAFAADVSVLAPAGRNLLAPGGECVYLHGRPAAAWTRYDPATGDAVRTYPAVADDEVVACFALSADGSTAAVAGGKGPVGEGFLAVYDAASGALVHHEVLAYDVDRVALSPDGSDVVLASIPADREERAAERADLERRYGVALFGADGLDEATPPEMEQWLYYAAGLKDSHAPLVEWETRQYEARLPDLAAVVAERVRDRLAEPFETLDPSDGTPVESLDSSGGASVDSADPSGRALVGSLDFEVERYVRSRESTWSGVPVELQSGGFRLSVDVALDWVDDGWPFCQLRSERGVGHEWLEPHDRFSDDHRADAEAMVGPWCVERVADALVVPLAVAVGTEHDAEGAESERADEEAASERADEGVASERDAEAVARVEECLARYGEAFVGPDADGEDGPDEEAFRRRAEATSEAVSVPHDLSVAGTAAYLRRGGT